MKGIRSAYLPRSRTLPRVAGAALLFAGFLASGETGNAQWASWDQSAHIRETSAELAKKVGAKGADSVSAEITQCYRDQSRASGLTKPLERCLIQDAVHSWMTAGVYSRVSKETLQKMNLPSPEAILEAMSKRVISIFTRYGIPQDKALGFMESVRQLGIAAYGQVLQAK
jgi:hypothetical protein